MWITKLDEGLAACYLERQVVGNAQVDLHGKGGLHKNWNKRGGIRRGPQNEKPTSQKEVSRDSTLTRAEQSAGLPRGGGGGSREVHSQGTRKRGGGGGWYR